MPGAMDYSLFADLYDVYVNTALDIPFFLQEASQEKGRVLELMSGTGRVSVPLIEAGIDLTCIDASPDMLRHLRQKLSDRGLSARVKQMDVCLLELGSKYELIFIPFHAFAEIATREDQQRALKGVFAHLLPGGAFVCTLHNPRVRLKKVDEQLRVWADSRLPDGGGRLLVWGLEKYEPATCTVHGKQFFEIYDPTQALASKRMVDFKFQIIEKDELETLADEAGFEVESLFGDYSRTPFDPLTSPYMIWRLRKPK